MKKTLFLVLGILMLQQLKAADAVPSKLDFCGIELSLDQAAQDAVAETISKLKRSPTYFQALTDRANIYLPFVEEAFELRGVPQDLKYIVIQESALVADAVSSSNAVGFWQFKEESAKESGLVIDNYVDERKHIFLSSLGAAKYFYNISRWYDNYLYAVIGYNRGPVGALEFVEVDDFGKRQMKITGKTHWYALKAIAHKLAFEEALGKSAPPMWLQPLRTEGETDVKRIAEKHGMGLDEFKQYNHWIKGGSLPEGNNYIYYLPRRDQQELALMRHFGGGKQIGGPKVNTPPPPKPKPAQVSQRDNRRFDYLEPLHDPDYGDEYVRAKSGQSLVEISVYNGVKVKKLQAYNDFSKAYIPREGDLIYLKPAKRRTYHIVAEGETLAKIASQYETTVEKLVKKNRISGGKIFAGQKLSLSKRVEKGAKPLLLAVPEDISQENPVEDVKVEAPKEKEVVVAQPAATQEFRLPAYSSKMVSHTAKQGESVWRVAKQYNSNSEVLRRINGIKGNELKPGQKVQVLQIIEQ